MTDVTSQTLPRHAAARRGGASEYRVYFGVIFATALPFACVSCLIDALTGKTRGLTNPVARARDEAGRITPWIFSA